MTNIRKKDLLELIQKRLFKAGVELANDAFEELNLKSDEISLEDAIAVLNLMKEGMHTEISKKTVDKIIEDLGKEFTKE